jgi:hypothetical protein
LPKRRRNLERKKRGLALLSVELEQDYRKALENISVPDLIKIAPKSIDIGSMRLDSLSARCRIIIGSWLEKNGYLK